MSTKLHTLSVIIITHNEAHRLADCLSSAGFADELIVVDSESTDNTVEIAKRYSTKVYIQPWLGFGRQKQVALQYVTSDWVLSLDADEILSTALQNQIKAMLQQPIASQPVGFNITSLNYFCGKPVHFGDWRKETKLRLFQRKGAKFSDEVVHERIILPSGKIGVMRSYLRHDSYPNLTTVIDKMQLYSTLGAEKRKDQGKSATFFTAITHSLWMFARNYIIRFGFLDGVTGFLVAFSRAEEVFYRYLKLREMGL